MVDYTVELFEKELNRRLAELQENSVKHSVTAKRLEEQRQQLREEVSRLADAIAAAGHSPALLARLVDTEKQIAELEAQIQSLAPLNIRASVSELRAYVARALPNLCSLLRENVHLAKAEMVKHLHELVLSPKQTQEGPVYEVKGDWKLLPEKECVIWLVARDGVEPPTPAFSGLDSTTVSSSLPSSYPFPLPKIVDAKWTQVDAS